MRKTSLALLAVVGINGCSLGNDRDCTASLEFGLWVHVNDRTTGDPMHDVRGQVRSGTYTDSLRDDGAGDGVYIALAERRGTFSMHLEHTGYTPLHMNGIVVTGGDCHVDPTVLHVTLVAVT